MLDSPGWVASAASSRILILLGALIAIGAAACSTSSPGFRAGGAEQGELEVHAAVVRFVAEHYQAAGRAGPPQAWCLAVGRRSRLAANEFRRDAGEPWMPSRRLLARLSDLQPPVIPVSECGHDDGQQERVLETNQPAVLIVVSHPVWETHETARVQVAMRESPTQSDVAVCRLVLRAEGWAIRDCV